MKLGGKMENPERTQFRGGSSSVAEDLPSICGLVCIQANKTKKLKQDEESLLGGYSNHFVGKVILLL